MSDKNGTEPQKNNQFTILDIDFPLTEEQKKAADEAAERVLKRPRDEDDGWTAT